jgi:anaerobic ribonucleoside-triphosphate reductase activating protein
MYLASTQYSLKHKALELYISGCKEHPCKSCHNPELFNEQLGEPLTQEKLKEIKTKITNFNNLIDNIFICGGEPLEKPEPEIIWLLTELKQTDKQIWLFTRYELNQISDNVICLCDYIKTSKYDETLLSDNYFQYGIQLASTNQKIIKTEEFK